MPTLPEAEIVAAIRRNETFEATAGDGSFTLKVESYVPYVCAAIHAGHRLRKDLAEQCLVAEPDRLLEEDPYTDDLIEAMPITVVSHDSRYEYDLNRPLAQCVYREAWGKKVWRSPLSKGRIETSRAKHRTFYRVLDALMVQLRQQFRSCLIFDVHTYNTRPDHDDPPTFNLGTAQIDRSSWDPVINRFLKNLNALQLSGLKSRATCDQVFFGQGYLSAHVNANHTDILVLPIEIRKVFMDQESGEPYPLILEELKSGFKGVLAETAALFARRHTRQRKARKGDMLGPVIDKDLREVDRQLHRLARGLEPLLYISPTNLARCRREFLRRGTPPSFTYSPLDLDPYLFREQLYRLPIEKISDPEIRRLYRCVVDSLATRIDLLTTVGSPQFQYSSLRHYGEPDPCDLANAGFILHATRHLDPPEAKDITASEAKARLAEQASAWGMRCHVELSDKIVANALVRNHRRALVINRRAHFGEIELGALAHHELGIHMATTLNALDQPLKVFSVGLPGATTTQEGLAILNEYLSGHLSPARLRTLALRVITVDLMLKQHDFTRTVNTLTNSYRLDGTTAFNLAVRIYRGGGFTKDYLYLRGLREVYSAYRERDLDLLMVGKTGLEWLDLLEELHHRGLVKKPLHLPRGLARPTSSDPVMEFMIRSLAVD